MADRVAGPDLTLALSRFVRLRTSAQTAGLPSADLFNIRNGPRLHDALHSVLAASTRSSNGERAVAVRLGIPSCMAIICWATFVHCDDGMPSRIAP